MIIEFFRSSSYNNWDYCQQQYYLNYVLGLPRSESKKALKGTITHKVLECLAILKFNLDKNPGIEYTEFDEDIGKFRFKVSDLLLPTTLTDDEVFAINRTRKNKYTYKHKCDLEKGTVRLGVDIVETLIKASYDAYCTKCEGWEPVDLKDIRNFVWMSLEYKNGMFDPRKRKIVAPEKPFEFQIKEDWAKIDYIHPCTGIKRDSYLTIRGTIDLITEVSPGILEIVDWKGLPIETPIPTPDGWKTMESLAIGDIVFDKDGKQTKVLGKSQVKTKPCYEITFDDKSVAICDNEHLWTLEDGSVIDITQLKVHDKISIAKPLDMPEQVLPIDPYTLGIWLGDGRNKNGEISSGDNFVYEEIRRRGYHVGEDINKKAACPSRTVFGLMTELRKLDLLHNKHIPQIYLRASASQRLDLLRGLLDSDGNANPFRKQAIFTNCNKKLSDDVLELLLTLGQRPKQHDVNGQGFGLDVKVYPVSFRPIGINPFLLPRKADRIDPAWGSGVSHRRLVKKITKVKPRQTQCIMVDSPTSTYLCTKNMIPTHNTGQRLDWATGQVKDYKKLSNDFQLMLYCYAARQVFPDAKHIMLTIFFARDGGPFTLCFDDKDIQRTKDMLKARFEEIKASTLPKLCDPTQRDFRCKNLCDYFTMPSPDKKYPNFCKYVHAHLKEHGIDKTTKDLTHGNHDINRYEAPGDLE